VVLMELLTSPCFVGCFAQRRGIRTAFQLLFLVRGRVKGGASSVLFFYTLIRLSDPEGTKRETLGSACFCAKKREQTTTTNSEPRPSESGDGEEIVFPNAVKRVGEKERGAGKPPFSRRAPFLREKGGR